MMTIKYLRNGYEAFLAFFMEERKEGVSLKELPIANEFEDVFQEDIPRLPLEKEIEFEIELVPGTAPIS